MADTFRIQLPPGVTLHGGSDDVPPPMAKLGDLWVRGAELYRLTLQPVEVDDLRSSRRFAYPRQVWEPVPGGVRSLAVDDDLTGGA